MSDRIEAENLDVFGEEVAASVDTPLVVIEGTKGDPGAPGKDGITPTIGDNGNWYFGTTDTGKPSRGEKGAKGEPGTPGAAGPAGAPGKDGAKGDPGAAGQDGHSPVVTATKSGKTTTISVDGAAIATVEDGADGAPGKDGSTGAKGDKGETGPQGPKGDPGAAGTPGKDGTNGKDGVDGKPGAAGADGITPHIGDNGNWYIGSTDTGKPSRGATGAKGDAGATGPAGAPGKDGKDGTNGITPTIGTNGNWYISNTDTGKPSRGTKGDPGAPGKDGAGMDITGATVGQIAKITAVDASGVPTAWGPVDMPSGGGSSGAVRYDAAQSLTFEQKQQARKNIEAADSVAPTITGLVSMCPDHITDSNVAVHIVPSKVNDEDYSITLDCGPENALVRVAGIRTPTDAQTNYAANVAYVKAKIAAIGAGAALPSVTAADNGKILRVVDGAWAAASLPVYNGGVS